MAFQSFGTTRLSEFLGENVVYRNLVPADDRLPALADLREDLGLGETIPRKAEPDYGRVVAEMLRRARALDRPGVEIAELVYIGDTRLNDGTAFRNILAAGGWVGWCFIGRDTPSQPLETTVEDALYVTNRWRALPAFLSFLGEQGLALDERTALVIDMDKTMVGARGRNDQVINVARIEGVQRTVAGLLGERFDLDAFRAAYDELNQSPYYGLTADNQDYLAYICLMLGAGLYDLDTVVGAVRSGEMAGFVDFIGAVQLRRGELGPSGLTAIHDDVWACVQQGDPTPFKAFRYNEYLTTVARFGGGEEIPVEDALQEAIVVTQEVRQAALSLREAGVLVFGLSDKPDEASVPSEAQAREGMRALHHLETLAVGEV